MKRKEINIEELVITDFEEYAFRWVNDFLFRIGEGEYRFSLLKHEVKNHVYYEKILHHVNNTCPFCKNALKENNTCTTLSHHEDVLFSKVLSHSKNRLRWLSEEIQ